MNFRKIDDIQIPDIMRRPIVSGVQELDKQMSIIGGIIPSQVILFTANPGAGKTTLSMVLLDNLSKNSTISRPSLFISLEMSDFQLKLQTERLGYFKNMYILGEEDIDAKKGLNHLINEIEKLNPSIIVIDSIQYLGQMFGYRTNQEEIVVAFRKFSKRTYIPTIFIGHVTKSGEYKGNSSIQHDVDTHIEIARDKETQQSYILPKKNRFGGIFNPINFEILPDGVVVGGFHYSRMGIKPHMSIDSFDHEVDNDDSDSDGQIVELVPASDNAVLFYKNKLAAIRLNNKKVNRQSTINVIHAVFDLLKNKYAEDLRKHNRLSISYRIKERTSAVNYCPSKNLITFGIKTMSVSPNLYGYKKEKQYINMYCRDAHDFIAWHVMHEFCHAFHNLHNEAFYTKLRTIAYENRYLFSTYTNNVEA